MENAWHDFFAKNTGNLLLIKHLHCAMYFVESIGVWKDTNKGSMLVHMHEQIVILDQRY